MLAPAVAGPAARAAVVIAHLVVVSIPSKTIKSPPLW